MLVILAPSPRNRDFEPKGPATTATGPFGSRLGGLLRGGLLGDGLLRDLSRRNLLGGSLRRHALLRGGGAADRLGHHRGDCVGVDVRVGATVFEVAALGGSDGCRNADRRTTVGDAVGEL